MIVLYFDSLKKYIFYYSDSSSSEEQMSQFMRTNKIYGKVAEIINGVSTNFYCLYQRL